MEQGEECDCGSEEVRASVDVIRFAVKKNSDVNNSQPVSLHPSFFDNKYINARIYI